MTRNTKIALGCGGAGCLGLIVVVIAVAVLIVTGVVKAPGLYDPGPDRNYNSNYNYNANSNNSNSDTNTNDNQNTNSDSSSSSSSMTDDDKHKLYQAAAITKDNELIFRMLKKIGLGNGAGSDHQEFLKEHLPWAMRNAQFVQSISTPEAARAYFDEHIDD